MWLEQGARGGLHVARTEGEDIFEHDRGTIGMAAQASEAWDPVVAGLGSGWVGSGWVGSDWARAAAGQASVA